MRNFSAKLKRYLHPLLHCLSVGVATEWTTSSVKIFHKACREQRILNYSDRIMVRAMIGTNRGAQFTPYSRPQHFRQKNNHQSPP